MYNFSKLFVSIFGVGFFPYASGTLGSFVTIIFFYFFNKYLSSLDYFFIFIVIFLTSIKLISTYSSFKKKHDSSEIIIDEFIGISFILIFYDYLQFTNDVFMFLLIFLLFRFFDIIKFFPAKWVHNNLLNSWGVILDDIIAGAYCVVVLYTLNVFL